MNAPPQPPAQSQQAPCHFAHITHYYYARRIDAVYAGDLSAHGAAYSKYVWYFSASEWRDGPGELPD